MEKAYQRLVSLSIARTIVSLGLTIVFVMAAFSVKAQGISLISDEETEQFLEDIIKPLFSAAGIKYNRNEVHIVNDASLNAFVSDGNNLFIHTGTILNASTPNELAGVIAHETGHIQGGHILRQKLKHQNMQEVGLASVIVASAAAIASGRGDVAMAAMMGSQSSMLTNYLRYRIEEERSADESALKLLSQTQQSPQGMLTFMKKIAKQNQLSGREETPYFRTHPITSERIGFFEQAVARDKTSIKQKLQDKFERVRAKLFAYLSAPQQTFRQYPLGNNSVAAKYARSIAFFKQLQFAKAMKEIDELIAIEPNNPYFYELKAQINLETGKIKIAKENYKKALDLMPSSALLQTSYAQSLLEDNPDNKQAHEAAKLLNKALISRPNGFAWMLLSRAYGEIGNIAGANYAAAEYSYRIGQFDIAKKQLKTAYNSSPSPQLKLKIDDLDKRLNTILERKK